MPPTSRVLATCVPPSAWRSSPTISIVRIVSIPSGSRLTLVRIRSGIANASARGRTATRTSRRGRQLGVDRRLDGVDEVARHPLELEVHATRARLHVAAGHQRAVVAPDDAAQGVQRGVGAHQRQPARPVEVDLDEVADAPAGRRHRARARGRSRHRPCARHGPSTIGRRRRGGSGRDPMAGRRRPGRRRCDRAPRAVASPGLDGSDPRLGGAGVGVDVAELLAGRGHRGATRSLGGERPDHRRVDGADEGVRARRRAPGRRRRRVATPLKTSPLNSSAPVASPRWSATLCGVPGSLFSNSIWNGVSAGAVTVVCSNLMPSALIVDQVRVGRSGRRRSLGGGGAARRRGRPTGPGCRSSRRWRRCSRRRSRRTAGRRVRKRA